MAHKAGFVNILGKPNVGKSTLMNTLVGERLSIITSKAQTTRHRIMGMVNGDDYQIVYSDTPGILKPNYKLHESMMKFVDTAFVDADIILFLTEPDDRNYDEELINKLNKTKAKLLVLINKIDKSEEAKINEAISYWAEKLHKANIIGISALHNLNTKLVFDTLIRMLPDSPPFFPKDELTDKPMRFFIAEIIREKILMQFKKEVPYSVEIEVESYKEEEKITNIEATIYVARESQKAIILGHKGAAIKALGTAARKDIEAFIDKHVFLELRVKVNKDWRENTDQLKRFGYEL